jgi:hypothetical protein
MGYVAKEKSTIGVDLHRVRQPYLRGIEVHRWISLTFLLLVLVVGPSEIRTPSSLVSLFFNPNHFELRLKDP